MAPGAAANFPNSLASRTVIGIQIQYADLVHLAFSPVIIAVSLTALLFAALQRKDRNLALAFFGCTFLLIGLRFLIGTSPIRALMSDHPDLLSITPLLLM